MIETDFKKKCRDHQSWFRSEILKVGYDKYPNVLSDEDGKRGLNFYNGFDIFKSVNERYPDGFRKPLYCNLLRSEHIPFNFFIPLDRNRNMDLGKKVFNEILGHTIDHLIMVIIEYSPKLRKRYLNDSTSFDTYVEYQHIDGTLGILGIEVKYTELSYPMSGETERERMKDPNSLYYQRSRESGVFNDKDLMDLTQDDYRQIWRNHLLGESILIRDNPNFNHFHSLTFYPEGNTHFSKVLGKYKEFLKPEYKDRVQGVTYERYFECYRKHIPNEEFGKWLEYLETRYLTV